MIFLLFNKKFNLCGHKWWCCESLSVKAAAWLEKNSCLCGQTNGYITAVSQLPLEAACRTTTNFDKTRHLQTQTCQNKASLKKYRKILFCVLLWWKWVSESKSKSAIFSKFNVLGHELCPSHMSVCHVRSSCFHHLELQPLKTNNDQLSPLTFH